MGSTARAGPPARLVAMARRLGRDSGLVQAGGGNISVKAGGGRMYVKASGTSLRGASARDFVEVGVPEVLRMLDDPGLAALPPVRREARIVRLMARLAQDARAKPSIEVFIHALLGRWVAHLHPVYVNALTCMRSGRSLARRLLPRGLDYLWLPYASPGYALGRLLQSRLRGRPQPALIFLENHGFVLSGEDEAGLYKLCGRVLRPLERYFGRPALAAGPPGRPAPDIPGVRLFPAASPLLKAALTAPRPRELFDRGALYSDQVVYCGERPLYAGPGTGPAALRRLYGAHAARHGAPPRVMIREGRGVALAAKTARAAAVLEEILEAHVKTLLLMRGKGRPRFLPHREALHLAGLECELYRLRRLDHFTRRPKTVSPS